MSERSWTTSFTLIHCQHIWLAWSHSQPIKYKKHPLVGINPNLNWLSASQLNWDSLNLFNYAGSGSIYHYEKIELHVTGGS
jgi:hypothetical protein